MERFAWICLAGAAGTGARYLITLWAAQRFGSAFPHGTLIANLVGCFAIAAVVAYSSFNHETSRLLEAGAVGPAMLNAATTILGGFAAGWLGLLSARLLLGR
jgi:CrcB protein